MAKGTITVAIIQLDGHDKTVRSYIEMRALYEAFAKAKAVAGGFNATGSVSYWDDMRSKVENHKRGELRKVYEKEVRQKLADVLAKSRRQGISVYSAYITQLKQKALLYRRQVDQLIYEDIEYARRDEGLFGMLGKLAVITKAGADISMAILGAAFPGAAATYSGFFYSGGLDIVSSVEATKDADVWCFTGTKQGLIMATGQPIVERALQMEGDKLAEKCMNWALVIPAIASALVEADESWKKFQ